MKKFLAGIVVLSLASMAFAVPAFSINGGAPIVIDLSVSDTVTVPVIVTGGAGTMGMLLGLQTTGLFEITDLTAGAGTVWEGNIAATILKQPILPASEGMIDAVVLGAAVNPNPGIVALVTIKALAKGAGSISTDASNSSLETASEVLYVGGVYAGATQDTALLTAIVPEPVSALLLLAGLPLIRRRRA